MKLYVTVSYFSDPPELELRMGATLNGTVIKEQSDLYLTCHVDANPEPHTLTFSHKVNIFKLFGGLQA